MPAARRFASPPRAIRRRHGPPGAPPRAARTRGGSRRGARPSRDRATRAPDPRADAVRGEAIFRWRDRRRPPPPGSPDRRARTAACAKYRPGAGQPHRTTASSRTGPGRTARFLNRDGRAARHRRASSGRVRRAGRATVNGRETDGRRREVHRPAGPPTAGRSGSRGRDAHDRGPPRRCWRRRERRCRGGGA